MNENKLNNLNKVAKQTLDKQAENLNSDTLQRLRLAREKALEQQNKGSLSNFISWKWLTGAGAGVALASLIAFMIVPKLTADNLSPLDDLELLTAEVDMDLVNDLEFYQWLDESLTESLIENINES